MLNAQAWTAGRRTAPHSRNRETKPSLSLSLRPLAAPVQCSGSPAAPARFIHRFFFGCLATAQFQLPSLGLQLFAFFSRSPRARLLGPATRQVSLGPVPVARLPPSAAADSAAVSLLPPACPAIAPAAQCGSAQCESISNFYLTISAIKFKPMCRSLQLCLIAYILSN